MRMVEYEESPGLGPGTLKRRGSLKGLVSAIPYFLAWKLIPPFQVLNAVLRAGGKSAGMSGGCKWEPFEIAPEEYEELVQSLRADGMNTIDAPDWVKTEADWLIWVLHVRNGVPIEEHRRLTREYDELEAQRKQAAAEGDADLAMDLFVQSAQAGERLSDFIMVQLSRATTRPGSGQP